MYFTSLPNHTSPDFDEPAHFGRFGKDNIIFHDKVKQSFCAKHVGCLSVKFVFSGREWYGFEGRQTSVEPGQFLILNNEQTYSCEVDSEEETEVFSIFFQSSLAAEVFRNWEVTEEEMLDIPFGGAGQLPEFFQTLYRVDSTLEHILSRLIYQVKLKQDCSNEIIIEVLEHMMYLRQGKMKQVMKVEALKPSTRVEIFKRVSIAREVLLSQTRENLDLQQLSKASCLSIPQLVRQFRAVYGKTPYQYLVNERLKRSAQLLSDTRIHVNEIANLCGFEDASAFSRAFKKYYRRQPTSYRQQNRIGLPDQHDTN